jgi:hypothetical protein
MVFLVDIYADVSCNFHFLSFSSRYSHLSLSDVRVSVVNMFRFQTAHLVGTFLLPSHVFFLCRYIDILTLCLCTEVSLFGIPDIHI